MNRWAHVQYIVIKAMKDPEFKKKLCSKPKEALQELLKNEKSIDLSQLEKINVRIVEEKKDEWVLALPCLESTDSGLPDKDLERMFGGDSCWYCSSGYTTPDW